jgi:hypothetical protein
VLSNFLISIEFHINPSLRASFFHLNTHITTRIQKLQCLLRYNSHTVNIAVVQNSKRRILLAEKIGAAPRQQ